ncbi:hypothetical protein [Nocardioides humi]|uniref:VWFA domain-containing protein n=1 Tax=Nocardioides humi TaxID=449461 RepID=A0ABN2A215_9ACTN|nr:hypothetical protein [Nocardioides humi]
MRIVHMPWRLGVGALLSLGLMSACGGPTDGDHTVVNFDVSRSANNAKANLVNEAKKVLAAQVSAMKAGDRVTAVGFNFAPGTSCKPLVFTIAEDANSEEERVQRAANTGGLPAAFDGYIECLTGESGFAGKGSAIFGSIPTALDKAQADRYPIDAIITVTEGCSYGEGVPVCNPNWLARDDLATAVVEKLPAELKPDLTGISLAWVGLGQGTKLQAPDIARLAGVYAAYAGATNAEDKEVER